MNNKNLYYNPYEYENFLAQNTPIPFNQPPYNSYSTSQFNDINERISRLERQTKRLEQRLTRLETPYANTNKLNNTEPDNNMYMM